MSEGEKSLDQGYEKITPTWATNFSSNSEQRQKRRNVDGLNPQPVEGGFIPLNNVLERL